MVRLRRVLHYWIEYGGQGPIHTHGGFVPQVPQTCHSHGSGQFRQPEQNQERDCKRFNKLGINLCENIPVNGQCLLSMMLEIV